MQNIKMPTLLIGLAICLSTYAQDPKATIEQKLESQYALTQPTADNADIVTAGAVLVLSTKRGGKDSNVVMGPVTSATFCQNTYKDGKVAQNAACKVKTAGGKWGIPLPIPVVGSAVSTAGAASGAETRTFVPGEKMWVTRIDVKEDSVVFVLFTDAFNQVRYKANLAFQFPKGKALSPELVEKTVAEVFKVQPAEEAKAGAEQQAPAGGPPQQTPVSAPPPAPQAPAQPAAEPAAIIPPPPPPPTDTPQPPPTTTSLGQTTDQVVANLGQPQKIIKLGAKQIYVYKDLKVIFVNGKVTDVQ